MNEVKKFMSGDDFRTWRVSRGLSLNDVGRFFGVSYQSIQAIEKAGATRVQALAISAIERGLKPWEPTDADRKRQAIEDDRQPNQI